MKVCGRKGRGALSWFLTPHSRMQKAASWLPEAPTGLESHQVGASVRGGPCSIGDRLVQDVAGRGHGAAGLEPRHPPASRWPREGVQPLSLFPSP